MASDSSGIVITITGDTNDTNLLLNSTTGQISNGGANAGSTAAELAVVAAHTSAIALNTSKVGITTAQGDAILANTAKVGITTAQGDAILANTAKVGITTAQGDAILAVTPGSSFMENFTPRALPVKTFDIPKVDLSASTLTMVHDPSNIKVVDNQNLNNGSSTTIYTSNAAGRSFATIDNSGVTIANSNFTNFFSSDVWTNPHPVFGSMPIGSGWRSRQGVQQVYKDISGDNGVIYVIGGGDTNSADGTKAQMFLKFITNSTTVSAPLFANKWKADDGMPPDYGGSGIFYNISDQKVLSKRTGNMLMDLNETVGKYTPVTTLLDSANYPECGSLAFDISTNMGLDITDVSGFLMSFNNLLVKSNDGVTEGASDVSFNDSGTVMCFGAPDGASGFNYTGSAMIFGSFADATDIWRMVGSIRGTINYSTKVLSGKQQLVMFVETTTTSKLSVFNNRNVLVEWDADDVNSTKSLHLLPETMGMQVGVMGKEIVMLL